MKKLSLFYKVLLVVLLLLLGAFLAVRFALLRPWLVRFEAAQPRHTGQAVFGELFVSGDWGRVWELAGGAGDREEFVRSMGERTAGAELTLVETSAGLSGGRRYIVKLGEESLAAFTLTAAGGTGEPAWSLGEVELLMDAEPAAVLVRTLEGQRVRVSGRTLGEDSRVQTTRPAAERYLPEGVFGRRTVLWEVPEPAMRRGEVSVVDGSGAPVPLHYDSASGRYAVEEPAQQPTPQERELLLGAAKTYARYMIRDADTAQLRRYFDAESEIYKTIRSSEIWIKATAGHTFSNEAVSGFSRCGEDVFFARVSLHMDVKRGNGTAKPYEVDATLFFHQREGAWRAYEMTNADVEEELVRTRLTFMDGERRLGQLWVGSEERAFTPPAPPERPGRRFAGWAVREREGEQVTMTVRFRPGPDGTVSLTGGVPEPLTLYAAYEEE